MKIFTTIAILLIMVFTNVNAQVYSSANFIKGSVNDAQKIMSSYLLPVERALSFNGANNNLIIFKHNEFKKIRFGIGLDISTSVVNSADFEYNISDLDLEKFEAADPNKTIAQTVSGNENTIVLQTKDKYKVPTTSFPFYKQEPIFTLNSPMGKNLTNIPFPTLHLFAEKEGNVLDFKISPPFKLNNKTLGLFEIGANLQHNLETSLKFLSDLWVDFYLTTGFNYTQVSYYLDIKPDETNLTFSLSSQNGPYDNQYFRMHLKSFPIKLQIVKPIKKFSFFAGLAYNFTSSISELKGNYPVYSSDPSNQFNIIVEDIVNPIHYTRQHNTPSINLGTSFQTKHFNAGLSYVFSYYDNIALTINYIY